MKIFGIFFAAIVLLFGFRMVITAFRMAMSGKVLVRKGIRSEWQPAPNIKDAWGAAFQEGLMGIMLIALGVALLT